LLPMHLTHTHSLSLHDALPISVTAFIHIPLNPEIQKPKINTIGIKTPNAVPSGNKKRVSADNDDVIAIMLRTITLYPLNTISLTIPQTILPIEAPTPEITKRSPAEISGIAWISYVNKTI